MQIPVEMLLIVRYTATTKKQEEDGWCPDPSSPEHLDRLPTRACLWVDPFWTGLTIERVGTPVVVQQQKAVVFHARGHFKPRTPCTIVRQLVPFPPPPGNSYSVCNSIKLHFFTADHSFVYASALPLRLLFSQQSLAKFGLFNYNRCDTSSAPLPGFELLALPTAAVPVVWPRNAVLYAVGGPQADHHERIMRISNWITDVLERTCVNLHTEFRNMRTYCRDQHSTFLSQDLQRYFQTPTTCLPPTLAVYAAHAALRLLPYPEQSVHDRAFLEWLLLFPSDDSWIAALPPLHRPRFMRLVRDLLACFTLCAKEGIYCPDMSLAVPVEDQPSPLDFMPSQRVFTKDDCEGRACQVHQVELLLCWMHRVGWKALLPVLRGMRSFTVLLVAVPPDEIERLVRLCCRIGGLLDRKILDVHTVVGDVHFASIQSKITDATTGHSFVICFLRSQKEAVLYTQVVEATGWERTASSSAPPPTSAALATSVQALLADYKQHDPRSGGMQGNLCGLVPPALEDRIYERLVLGNNCIFFTMLPQTGEIEYGAELRTVRRDLRTYADIQPNKEEKESFAFTITTREFLQALTTGKGPWARQPGAKAILAHYQRVEADLPAIRRCLRPPQKDEALVERFMCETWAPILRPALHDWDTTTTTTTNNGPSQKGEWLTFNVPTLMNGRSAGVSETLHAQIAERLFSSCEEVRSFPFMSSRLFACR